MMKKHSFFKTEMQPKNLVFEEPVFAVTLFLPDDLASLMPLIFDSDTGRCIIQE